jgi:hypothetical protein
MHTCKHTYIHTDKKKDTDTDTYTHSHTHTHTHTCTACTHTLKYPHTEVLFVTKIYNK